MRTAEYNPVIDYRQRVAEEGILQDQFSLPTGLMGKIVGWWMSRANRQLNRVALRQLQVRRGDSVLEIGFGPGQAIDRMVRRTRARFIAGIDPSAVMVEHATARNQGSLETGRVKLVQGIAEDMPFEADSFSKVVAISNLLVWNSPQKGLDEAYRVMKPGGKVVICQRSAPARQRWWKSPGITEAELDAIHAMLACAGFHDLRVTRRPLRRIVCISGWK